MSTIFFKISDQQEKEVRDLMQQEGYSSKAEFFRFLVKYFKFTNIKPESRLEKASRELKETLIAIDKKGQLGIRSLDEQLADV